MREPAAKLLMFGALEPGAQVSSTTEHQSAPKGTHHVSSDLTSRSSPDTLSRNPQTRHTPSPSFTTLHLPSQPPIPTPPTPQALPHPQTNSPPPAAGCVKRRVARVLHPPALPMLETLLRELAPHAEVRWSQVATRCPEADVVRLRTAGETGRAPQHGV